MAEHTATLICASSDLIDGGPGMRFGTPRGEAFVVRYRALPRAWLNRCRHRPMPLDMNDGRFFSLDGHHLVCSTHGAHFRASDGLCVSGPCPGLSLEPVDVVERDGGIWWVPG